MFKKNMTTILMSIMFCMLVIYIVIFPNESFKASNDGLILWFNVVLPALLPFFICVEILIGLGIVSFLGSCFRYIMRPIFNLPGEGAFAFFMSIASGYPVGAKITASLLENNICSKVEAQRMLSLCSTSGPLFIIGAVSTGILGNSKLGLILAFAHYLSAISAGVVMRFWGDPGKKHDSYKIMDRNRFTNPLKEMLEYRKQDGRPFGMLMGDAVKNGANLIIMIGGFIILFSVITAILKSSGILGLLSNMLSSMLPFLNLNPQAVSSVIIGMLEVTNGVKESALIDMPLISKLMLISFMIGFGGLSINAQVLSVIARVNLRFGLYSMMKLFQGIAAAFYTYLIFSLLGVQQVFHIYDSINASLYSRYLNSSMFEKIGSSTFNLLLIVVFMVIFTITFSIKRAKA
ncbi:MAG: sporulation integral membrane protein YlbJ [Clostridiales bacterium GWB2_37_7]|nr:MAG: sporulation integral membrane protein YlbJ [Clostridiales bacterium GWB2_37_7]